MKKSTLLAILILACLGATAQDDTPMATRHQQFAFDIFQQVAGNEEAPNLCFSPLSANMALSMVINGANGNTLDEMLTTLRTKGLSCEDVNLYNKQLKEKLTSLPPFKYDPSYGYTEQQARDLYEWAHPICEMANAVWTGLGFSCYESFYETLRTYYDAGVGSVDFSSQEGIDEINNWVEENTHGLIPKIYDEPQDPLLLVVLANMLYFKGCWTYPFPLENTKPGLFHQADDTDVETEMMNAIEVFKMGKTMHFNTVTLPYGDGKFTMTIFLPYEGVELPMLTFDDWKEAIDNAKYADVHVQLPRFSIEGKYELKDLLQAMGIHDAFGGDADFSRMSDEYLYISRVFQCDKIGVDEKGTEAAAVTVVEMRKYTTPEADKEFIVDRPFYFTIQSEDDILFAGRVNQLQETSVHPSTILGDVNGDGEVTVTDVTMIVAHILGQQNSDFIATNADINHDGSITITDISESVSIILGK